MKYIHLIKSILIIMVLSVSFAGCDESIFIDKFEVEPPVISDFSPKTGAIGSEIVITGSNLQRVDTVFVGGGLAEIKYRVSNSKIVATIISTCRNGKVMVSNAAGTSESVENFEVSYLNPVINGDAYPTSGTVNEEIVLVGENLHVIDSILLGDKKVSFISKRPNEIVFKVPFSDNESPVAFRYVYFDGTQNLQVGPAGETFTILKEAPFISFCPATLTKYTPVTVQGERLLLIDSMFVGNVKVQIKMKKENEIVFDMPSNYFNGNMKGVLTGVYYGVRKVIMNDDFKVFADPNEPRFYSYTNILLSSRAQYGGTENAFFDAETGSVISSCDAAANKSNIDFYLYDQSGYVQLYGPHNGASTVKNFKCNNVSIDPNDGSWNDFYGLGGIETKFKVLTRDSAHHLAVINAFESGSIVEIKDDLFAGIPKPGTSSPRIYKLNSSSGYSVASGHFSIDKNNIGWVRNSKTGKNGIIKVTGMPKDAVNGRIPELTFDIIWQK